VEQLVKILFFQPLPALAAVAAVVPIPQGMEKLVALAAAVEPILKLGGLAVQFRAQHRGTPGAAGTMAALLIRQEAVEVVVQVSVGQMEATQPAVVAEMVCHLRLQGLPQQGVAVGVALAQ
jgi:hypothetical protein